MGKRLVEALRLPVAAAAAAAAATAVTKRTAPVAMVAVLLGVDLGITWKAWAREWTEKATGQTSKP